MSSLDYRGQVERLIERVEESDEIHPENKQAIQDFKRDLKLDGLSDAWVSKLLGHLVIMAEHVGERNFRDLETGDIKDLVEWVQSRETEAGEPVSDATVSAYKQAIKRFWRWLADMPQGEHPEEVDWINTKGASANSNGKLPKDLLTREDIDDLKEACRNSRDRAFISILYETGARIGELIDLTVGDIEDHAHGRKVIIDGKTGSRRLPLLEATPAINKWLNDHPEPVDDAPLWCQLQDGSSELSYHYIRQKLLVRAKERADLDKPVNPHHFRHSRATHLANEFKEAQLCEWFGWVQGSDVPAKYVHLSGRDIDNAYTSLHGIESEDEEEQRQTIEECWRCQELNEAGDRFCSRCGATIDADTAQSLEEQVDSTIKDSYREANPADDDTLDKLDALDELLDDPDVKEFLIDRVEMES